MVYYQNLELGTNQYPPENRYIVFVNPKSGTGKAKKIFKKNPKRMLKEAEIEYTLIITGTNNYYTRLFFQFLCQYTIQYKKLPQ